MKKLRGFHFDFSVLAELHRGNGKIFFGILTSYTFSTTKDNFGHISNIYTLN